MRITATSNLRDIYTKLDASLSNYLKKYAQSIKDNGKQQQKYVNTTPKVEKEIMINTGLDFKELTKNLMQAGKSIREQNILDFYYYAYNSIREGLKIGNKI